MDLSGQASPERHGRSIGFLGGLIDPDEARELSGADDRQAAGGRGREPFLRRHPLGPECYRSGPVTLLVRGYAVLASPRWLTAGDGEGDGVAEAICRYYREHDDLPLDRLEGSFTLVLLDADRGRVLLYRNLIGNGFTYYAEAAGGLVFGGNLAELVGALDRVGRPPRPNRGALPSFFLYRFVPGRETLFEGVHRVMPGELVEFGPGGLRRSQRQTFADLRGDDPGGLDDVDRLEEVMGRVLADYAGARPRAANTLSGGVDSSYIQAHWNRATAARGVPSLSYGVHVEHPYTARDTEYALTAAAALGSEHRLVAADRPYPEYLLGTIASTGEPPNHVQTAYFGHLARAMRADGVDAALCGEGADSLFGLGSATALQMARLLRGAVPSASLRRGLAALTTRAGHPRLPGYLRLADRLDALVDPAHPVNRVAVFADLDATRACFGSGAVAAAMAYRRGLLEQYRVPADPLERAHAVGFLGEAIDSASLWTTLFNAEGCDLLCPFLDSRLMRMALSLPTRRRYPFRRPKGLLKRALERYMPRDMVHRSKLGFGQPIFEWMASGGPLRPWIDRIDDHDFLDRVALERARARPDWFLYSLLCYDLWYKQFIERSSSPGIGLREGALRADP